MAGNPNQKLKLLYIAEFFRRRSDKEHSVSVGEIIEYLSSKGINAERKSVYNDIAVLRDYGMPITRGSSPSGGYRLEKTRFDIGELIVLADALQASPIISQKKTLELIDKLRDSGSDYQSAILGKLTGADQDGRVVRDSRRKTEGEEIFHSVAVIQSAIATGYRIRFIYHRRMLVNNLPVFDTGREFIISPYATMWNNDKYYVVGNYDKYDDLSHYRIDRMTHVEKLPIFARSMSEVCSYTDRFDTDDYSRRVFNMYSGDKQETVELECEERLLEEMISRFGLNIPYKKIAVDRFIVRANVAINDGLIKWILNFGGGVVVRAPKSLRESVRKKLAEMYAQYEPKVK